MRARERRRWESRGVRPRSESRSSSFVSTRARGGEGARAVDGFLERPARGKKPQTRERPNRNRTEPTDETTRARRRFERDDTILFDDGARSRCKRWREEIYDESPAMQNAQMCLSWRPETKKRRTRRVRRELTNHIKSQKETLKQLLQHKDEMTSRCQDIERDYKTNVIEATANAPKHTTGAGDAEELAEVKAERKVGER